MDLKSQLWKGKNIFNNISGDVSPFVEVIGNYPRVTQGLSAQLGFCARRAGSRSQSDLDPHRCHHGKMSR